MTDLDISDADVRACVLLNFAHIESHRAQPDIKRLTALLYEAIHRSHHHADAWFAAYMCYQRVGMTQATERAWHEVCERGDAAKYAELASRYY